MMATLPKKREQDRKQVLSSTRQGEKEHAQHLLKRHRQEGGSRTRNLRTKEDLKMHNEPFHHHSEDEVEPNEGKINDWHKRHEDKTLEIFCDNHPDAFECRVYDD